MYLSRVEINTENRQIMRELNNVGAYHNWVERSFPEEIENGIRTRKLWRVDKLGDKKYLLLLSESKPNIELLEQYGVKQTGATKNYINFINQLKTGDKLKFRLVANPTISKFEGSKVRGKVVPCNSEESQIQYLLKKSVHHGFSLLENEFYILENSSETYKKGKVELKKVTYEGYLTIENIDIFRETLLRGIGRKKAYGFGMLTVLPNK
ncbi:type I-E CRISPR-associated protein Cas6/Cse3/CasE [Gemelliphila palaticanis]|uniref:Type I-E CRISPR-associated protein Cas6/Cse3/CasE n=1 Tax=Gemelliphila palaticanis TaxID=81950 RepID=A0ABX2T518_9BACL|nr:type I-E CRISPR-associated protein Cas6/Cse3/CasE [Gemella palaticanis]MBF0716171.1 type I-E CRISPR-associated protein Cas6/Cse3/CasE [Gemella palaticanis]NYS48101.1 type I-E CRISPR-associated protein Cas6/Cse3/CasE [Gemella palaticanis]